MTRAIGAYTQQHLLVYFRNDNLSALRGGVDAAPKIALGFGVREDRELGCGPWDGEGPKALLLV